MEHCECVEPPALPYGFDTRAHFDHFCDVAYLALTATGLCVDGAAEHTHGPGKAYVRIS
jgi:hypothetical protein